jgi:riboflavin kinase/FMN adenylyltransferase
MKLLVGTEEITPITPYPVVAIGNFDGLHLGHQALLQKTVQRAKEKNGTSVVLTFRPHPSAILSPSQPTQLLTPFEEKRDLVAALGIDVILFVEFSKEFAHQTPAQFAENLLAEKVGCKEVFVGERFAFGKNRSGKVSDLVTLGKKIGFEVFPQETVFLNHTLVSSSTIRELLQAGNVGLAAKMLSRPYALEGEVLHGDGAGKRLGFATANMNLPGRIVPKEGIYAARTTLSDNPHSYDSVVYIGSKPTFHEKGTVQIEAHLFDYDKDLYGQKIKVAFLEWIRADEKFESSLDLIKQMQRDTKKARSILMSR